MTSMSSPVVPKQLNYNDVLPVAIESRSNKRTFEPTNGTTFAPDANRIIRLNINSDNLCDFTHSYLQFTVTNKTSVVAPADAVRPASLQGAAGEIKITESAAMHLDFGVPFIKRMQILSGGQELEDIDEYGRLYSILLATQGNPEQENELSMNQGRMDANYNFNNPSEGNILQNAITTFTGAGLGAAGAGAASVVNARQLAAVQETFNAAGENRARIANAQNANNPYLHNGRSDFEIASEITQDSATAVGGFGRSTPNKSVALYSTAHPSLTAPPLDTGANVNPIGYQHTPGQSAYTYNIPLVSAILNNSKYWPLIFTNLGLDIYLHLEDAVNVGAFRTHLGITETKPKYEISNVRFHAHLVDVDRSFYDRMRMAMQAAGGVLQMSGTTYKHYMDVKNRGNPTHTLQISTRLKSLNALIVRPQRQELNNRNQHFCVSVGEGCFMNKYSFRVGSIQYPQSGVTVSDTNPGEAYSELKKTFGVLGDYSHNNFINKTTFERGVGEHKPGTPYSFFTACYGFEGFAKTAAESGINVSDRALPVTCEIERSTYPDTLATEGGFAARVYGDTNIVRAPAPGRAENPAAANLDDASDFNKVIADNIRYDIFAVTDMIIYITADGSVSTRI